MSVDSVFAGGPRMLGRYELLAPVARGGMGQVWAGRLRGARGFNKLVAIKTLLSTPDSEGRLEGMLFEEARIASLIHHANVVQTLELGEHEHQLYLVMEWVDGESLDFIVRRTESSGGVPLAIAAHWVGQTLLGLHAAHELADDQGALLGVVHRDVSPHNVLVTYSGVAKLVDFGIAKAMNQSTTLSGDIKGKLSYIAPEQVLGDAVDRRADIFGVGIILYLLTTGRHPFKRPGCDALLQIIADDRPATPPSAVVPGYPTELEAVVLKALEKERERRWSSAEEMLRALQRAVPQAFEPGIEAQLKPFLSDLLGERASMRRETLREAQLAADSRAANPSSPARSNTSLRAVSVDAAAAEAESTLAAEPMPFAPRPKRRSRAGLLAAAGALVVAVGSVLALRAPSAMDRTPAVPEAERARSSIQAAPSPVEEMVTSEAVPIEPVPAAGASARPAEERPISTSTRPPRRQPRRSSARNSDLIKPDYAR